jgi:hypothetical protein
VAQPRYLIYLSWGIMRAHFVLMSVDLLERRMCRRDIHSTAQQLIQPERGIAWLSSFFLALMLYAVRPRPVNSGVMLLSLF